MNLNARAIAVQGFGYGARLIALQGFGPAGEDVAGGVALRRSNAGRADDFDHGKPARERAKAKEAARRALAAAEARALAEIALRPPRERPEARRRLAAIVAGGQTSVEVPQMALFAQNEPEMAVFAAKQALDALDEAVQETAARRFDNRRRAMILAALLALDS